MEYCCYILYSKKIERYYIGYTSDLEERLYLHQSGFFGGKSYTHKTDDWELFLQIPCTSIIQAVNIERRIKGMKSQNYIQNLKKYPEIVEKLVNESSIS